MRRSIGSVAVLSLLAMPIVGCAARGFSPRSGEGADPQRPPSLRWKSFPTEEYQPLQDRITDISYELRIWKAYTLSHFGRAPESLIYSRTGLSHPIHRVEEALDPKAVYVWSVRAHFKLDGQRRATPWATKGGWSRTAALPEEDFAPIHMP